MNIATTFAAHVQNTAPKAAIDASFERLAVRNGLNCINVGFHIRDGGDTFFVAYAHRGGFVGGGTADTLTEAVSKALVEVSAKCGMIGLEGELA